jgi:hypothetical protein
MDGAGHTSQLSTENVPMLIALQISLHHHPSIALQTIHIAK